MNSAPCNCHTQTTKPGLNERPRYYARQLVTPDDMTLEQDYFRARLRRHNRYLHGWGVVCGAEVVPANKPWKVIVKAGYVLGPYGDEIYIESDQCVDVRKLCVPETPDDDECLEAPPPQPETEDRWLAIRYVEKKTRLVKVPLGGCGCEDSTCEHTRYQDHYEICVIDHCPESHQNPPDPPSFGKRRGDGGIIASDPAPECPACQEEPWVVLSAFSVDETGTVQVQQCACRRQVVSFGDFWWSCSVRSNDGVPQDRPAEPVPTRPVTPQGTEPQGTRPQGTQPGITPPVAEPVTPVTPASRRPAAKVTIKKQKTGSPVT
jgi:hypothetical protein